jgi:hypothetical protein
MGRDMDTELLPRVRQLIADLDANLANIESDSVAARVFRDLRDRVRGYLHWATAMRSVCTWVSSVYGYLESDSDEERAAHEKRLQDAIDLDLKNTAELLDLIETTDTEFMVVSAAGNHTYFYGEDLPELLRKRIALTTQYRHHKPRIDREILWREVPGTKWPEGWVE